MGRREELTAEKVCWAGGQEDRKPTSKSRAGGRERVRQPWERGRAGKGAALHKGCQAQEGGKVSSGTAKDQGQELSWWHSGKFPSKTRGLSQLR